MSHVLERANTLHLRRWNVNPVDARVVDWPSSIIALVSTGYIREVIWLLGNRPSENAHLRNRVAYEGWRRILGSECLSQRADAEVCVCVTTLRFALSYIMTCCIRD